MQQHKRIIPVLSIADNVRDFEFYENAFGAKENWRISNPDGSVHVAEISLSGMLFRLHEQSKNKSNLSPAEAGFTTVTIALEVEDVKDVMAKATNAGATVITPPTDYDYGYRQGLMKDPLGHYWLIEQLLDKSALEQYVEQIK